MLGVHRPQEEGEPSLFFAVDDQGSTLSVEGWFLFAGLEEFFELALYDPETGTLADVLIVHLTADERTKRSWQSTLILEVRRRGLRPN